MPAMLIVANMRKILYPRSVTSVGVTFESTKSTSRASGGAEDEERGRRRERTEDPLGGAGGRETVVPRAGREDVRAVHPSVRTRSDARTSTRNSEDYSRKRSPPHTIEAHINVQHRRHSLTRGRRVIARRRGRVRLEERADDEEERAHADRGDEERHLTPEGVDEEEDEECGGDELHDAVNPGREERVRRAVVSDLQSSHMSTETHTKKGETARTDWNIWGA